MQSYGTALFCPNYTTLYQDVNDTGSVIANDIILPKRKPLPDGRLPMTSEELLEFNQHMELTEIKKVFIKNGFIYYTFLDLDIILSDVKAIIYLNTLFDLTGEK